jgi:hypothetical protein
MKFLKDVEMIMLGGVKHVHIPLTAVNERLIEVGMNHPEYSHEYEVRLRWGFHGFCRPKDIDRMKASAIRRLKHDLYGDLKREILSLQKDAFDCNWDAVNDRVQKIINEYEL